MTLSRAFGGVARTSRSMRRYKFAAGNRLIPSPFVFAGGGNRQRRRIIGAVGPERANYARRARTYSDVSWAKEGTGTGSAPVIVSESVADPDGGTTATRVTFDLGGGTTLSDVSRLLQYEPTGTTVGAAYTHGLWAKIPLGESILVRNVGASAYSDLAGTGGWKRYSRTEISAAGQRVVEIGLRGGLPGAIGSDAVTVDLWWATLEDGTELTPVVPNDTAGTVTTTDWPRRNKASVSEGTTANLDAALYITDAPRTIEGFDNAIAIPRADELPGTGYAYKVCAFPDGTLVTVSLFVEMDDGGAPVLGTIGSAGYDFVLVADGWGQLAADCVVEHVKDRLYRVSTSRVANVAGGGNAFYGLIKYAAQSNRACRVTGWHVRDSGGIIDTYIKSGSGGTSVVTPPFGELVTVAANQPRIEYGPDGIGRGVMVERGSANKLDWSQPKAGADLVNGWVNNGPGVGANWIDNAARVPGGALTATYMPGSSGTKYSITSELTAGAPYTVTWRVKSAGATYYPLYADSTAAAGGAAAHFQFASRTFTAVSGLVAATAYEALEDGWFDVSLTFVAVATGSAAVHAYSSDGGLYIGDVMCEPGASRTSMMPSAGSGATAPAESITCTDLTALGMSADAWTIVVTAHEPHPDPTPGYPTLLRIEGAGGSLVVVQKLPDGRVEGFIYDGTTSVYKTVPAGTPGAFRKYAIGFSRTAGLMRFAATGAAVAEAIAGNLTTLPSLHTATVGSISGGSRHINGVIKEVATAPRLLSAAEIIQEIES